MDSSGHAHSNENPFDLMYSILVMSRANEESNVKAKRVAAAWQEKRANGATKPLTAKCPSWLRLNKETGKFEMIADKASLVRRVLSMATNGMGAIAITQTLNREGLPTFTPSWKNLGILDCAAFASDPHTVGRVPALPHGQWQACI